MIAATLLASAFAWWVPDFVQLQSGGYSGLVSAGFGYAALGGRLNAGLSYGYVPHGVAGRAVHCLALALSVRIPELALDALRIVPLYAGAGLLHTWGAGYFVTLPDRYSAGYYRPTALHPTFHAGLAVDWLPESPVWLDRHGVYVELTALEVFVRRYARNPETIALHEIVSLGVGYRATF